MPTIREWQIKRLKRRELKLLSHKLNHLRRRKVKLPLLLGRATLTAKIQMMTSLQNLMLRNSIS
jgi:hypothetical protein